MKTASLLLCGALLGMAVAWFWLPALVQICGLP